MKTKEQVLKYLSVRSFDEDEWYEVRNWMRERFCCGLRKARRPVIDGHYSELLDWFDNQLGEGDVVITDSYTGIVHITTDGVVVVAACQTKDGVFDVESFCLTETYRLADIAEKLEFEGLMKKMGYDFNISLGTITKRPLPPANKIIRFEYQGETYIGIPKSLQDNAIVFWVTERRGKIERDLKFPAYEMDFFNATKTEQYKFNIDLGRASLMWDEASNSLLSHIKRAERNKIYYYLNDRFDISQDKDTRSDTDHERYKNRNYFLRYEEALRFRQQIYNLRAVTTDTNS